MPDPYDDLHYLLATHDGSLLGLLGPYCSRGEAEASVGSNPAKWLGSRGARFDVLTINRSAHPAFVRALARSATAPAVDEGAVYRASADAIRRAAMLPDSVVQAMAKAVTAALAPLVEELALDAAERLNRLSPAVEAVLREQEAEAERLFTLRDGQFRGHRTQEAALERAANAILRAVRAVRGAADADMGATQ